MLISLTAWVVAIPLWGQGSSVTDPRYGVLGGTDLFTWHRYDGVANRSPLDSAGGRYPRYGSGHIDERGFASVVNADGIVFGAKVFKDAALTQPADVQPIRVGGSTYVSGIRPGVTIYSSGLRPGWVESEGSSAVPVNTLDPRVKVYWVLNKRNADETHTAARWFEKSPEWISGAEVDAVRDRATTDWSAWPVDLGAPYINRSSQNGYSPIQYEYWDGWDEWYRENSDEPGIAGPLGQRPGDEHLWMVFNDLDTARTRSFAGSDPIGLEIQKTVWGYTANYELSDMYFTRYLIINKGGVDTSSAPGFQGGSFWIDSMYFGQWSDPDIGDFYDDYVGCDTVLDMGYAYNANSNDRVFSEFGLSPPAVGYVVLQGPVRPAAGQEAIRNFQRIMGYENIGLSSFSYFATGSPYSEPNSTTYDTGSGRWWKVLRGFLPLGSFSSPDEWYPWPSSSQQPSPFYFPGDPVTGTGFIDGQAPIWEWPFSDRRMLMGIGPFSLAPGDTQEVIIATVAGIGADRLSSITSMKAHARFARMFAQTLFDGYQKPVAPTVRAIALDGAILLEWGSNPDSVANVERDLPGDPYAFEGYVVYTASDVTQWGYDRSLLATIDRADGVGRIDEYQMDWETDLLLQKPLFLGNDKGLKRYMLVTKDQQEQPLVNGHEYSFAVSSYRYADDPSIAPRAIESAATLVTAVPGIPLDKDLATQVGDTLNVSHETGSSSVRVIPFVVDPTVGTGHTYEVRFDTTSGVRSWSVADRTTGHTVLTNQQNFSSNDEYMMIDGGVLLIVRATGPNDAGPDDIFSFTIPAPLSGSDVQKENLKRVGVFPNPVYLTSSDVIGGGTRRVTFINLPERATIRIYNLAGQLVTTIDKDSPSTIYAWDLTNSFRALVASGMYIAYIEFPDLGTSKVLKLAVIQGYPVEY